MMNDVVQPRRYNRYCTVKSKEFKDRIEKEIKTVFSSLAEFSFWYTVDFFRTEFSFIQF